MASAWKNAINMLTANEHLSGWHSNFPSDQFNSTKIFHAALSDIFAGTLILIKAHLQDIQVIQTNFKQAQIDCWTSELIPRILCKLWISKSHKFVGFSEPNIEFLISKYKICSENCMHAKTLQFLMEKLKSKCFARVLHILEMCKGQAYCFLIKTWNKEMRDWIYVESENKLYQQKSNLCIFL